MNLWNFGVRNLWQFEWRLKVKPREVNLPVSGTDLCLCFNNACPQYDAYCTVRYTLYNAYSFLLSTWNNMQTHIAHYLHYIACSCYIMVIAVLTLFESKQLVHVYSCLVINTALPPAGGRWDGVHWAEELHPPRPESCKYFGKRWAHLQSCWLRSCPPHWKQRIHGERR